MIWRICLVFVLCTIACGFVRAQDQAQPGGLLPDVQAADLMSELLTYYGNLANRRIDAMDAYIKDIGKSDDYSINRPAAPERKEMTFAEAFKGAIQFVNNGGAKFADPALAKLTPDQLSQELDAMQHYNIQQFLYLNVQRDEIARRKAYLDSLGKFNDYLDWCKTHAPRTENLLSKAPTTQDSAAFARWLEAEVGAIKPRAWKHAQAQGMTQAQFDKEWDSHVEDLKKDLSNRIDAVKTLGAYFAPRPAQPQAAASGTNGQSWAAQGAVTVPPLPNANPGANAGPGQANTPPAFQGNPLTPNDPRWTTGYYGPNRPFGGWDDSYSDVYTPNGGGGVTARYDTRVNNDYDTRVNGEIDRRVNTSYDRRLNIQIDPRVNY